MATHPTILSDMLKAQTDPQDKTTLDVERDLGLAAEEPPEDDTGDPSRDAAGAPTDTRLADGGDRRDQAP